MSEAATDPAPGTLRPDLIESGGSAIGATNAAVIKTHHNDTALVRQLRDAGRIIEPLRDYHKVATTLRTAALTTHHPPPTTHHSPRNTHSLLTHYSPRNTHPLLTTHYSPLTTHTHHSLSPLTTPHSPLPTHYSTNHSLPTAY